MSDFEDDFEESEVLDAEADDDNLPTQTTDDLVNDLIDIVEAARPVPMSASVMINRDEVLYILDDILANLPDEIRASRWLLKERDEVMAKARSDAEQVMEDAKSNAARLVQRQEIVKASEQRAREIIEDAEAESRRMSHETEDFCDQRLASFENTLEKLTRTVVAGRRKLAATIEQTELADSSSVYTDDEGSEAADFFDQEID